MAPNPPTFAAPRRSRVASQFPGFVGAPIWPPNPPTFVAIRRSRVAPLFAPRRVLSHHQWRRVGVEPEQHPPSGLQGAGMDADVLGHGVHVSKRPLQWTGLIQ